MATELSLSLFECCAFVVSGGVAVMLDIADVAVAAVVLLVLSSSSSSSSSSPSSYSFSSSSSSLSASSSEFTDSEGKRKERSAMFRQGAWDGTVQHGDR